MCGKKLFLCVHIHSVSIYEYEYICMYKMYIVHHTCASVSLCSHDRLKCNVHRQSGSMAQVKSGKIRPILLKKLIEKFQRTGERQDMSNNINNFFSTTKWNSCSACLYAYVYACTVRIVLFQFLFGTFVGWNANVQSVHTCMMACPFVHIHPYIYKHIFGSFTCWLA